MPKHVEMVDALLKEATRVKVDSPMSSETKKETELETVQGTSR